MYLERVKITAEKIAEASGATAEVRIDNKTIVTYNDTALVRMMLPSLAKAANGNLAERQWVTGSRGFFFLWYKGTGFLFYTWEECQKARILQMHPITTLLIFILMTACCMSE